MPGIQQTLNPLIRFQRARTSSMVAVSAWPRCSDPVTLGGGSTIENGGLSLTASARENPLSPPPPAPHGQTPPPPPPAGQRRLASRGLVPFVEIVPPPPLAHRARVDTIWKRTNVGARLRFGCPRSSVGAKP